MKKIYAKTMDVTTMELMPPVMEILKDMNEISMN